MRRRASRFLLGGASLCAAVACGAACSNGTKTRQRPAGPVCQVLWASPGTAGGRYDIYLLEMEKEAWAVRGEHHFSVEGGVFGMFYDEYALGPTGVVWESRAIAIEGSFVVSTSLGAPYPGTPIATTDDGNQTYVAIDDEDELGDPVATGGAGTFRGVWSTEGDVAPDPGIGEITLALVGSTELEIGSFSRYAQCYEQESP